MTQSGEMHIHAVTHDGDEVSDNARPVQEGICAYIQELRRPTIFQSDNGSEFKNSNVRAVINSNGSRLVHSRPYSPRTNGKVERKIRTLAQGIHRRLGDRTRSASIMELAEAIRRTSIDENNAIHSRTQYRPIVVATERRAVLRRDTYQWNDGVPLSPEEVVAMVGGITRSQGLEACRIVARANASTASSKKAATIEPEVGRVVSYKLVQGRAGKMRSKVHCGVILSISALSQTANVRADDGNKHIVRLVDLVGHKPVDSVIKGLMDLYNGMRMERQNASIRENHDIQTYQEKHTPKMDASTGTVANADSGAGGAFSSDAGTRVRRFKRQRVHTNTNCNDGDVEATPGCKGPRIDVDLACDDGDPTPLIREPSTSWGLRSRAPGLPQLWDVLPHEPLQRRDALGRRAMDLVSDVWRSTRTEELVVDYGESWSALSYRHAKALDPNHCTGWLGDDVINLWIELCRSRDGELCGKGTGRRHACFLNTFFFVKLRNNRWSHEALKKWTTKMDLAGARKVYIPINHEVGGRGLHWSLCVADMEKKRVIHYDSFKNRTTTIQERILDYLEDDDDWKEGNMSSFEPNDWEIVQDSGPTPEQKNGKDCGVFTCQFIAFLNENIGENFDFKQEQEDMVHMRWRMMYSILYGEIV